MQRKIVFTIAFILAALFAFYLIQVNRFYGSAGEMKKCSSNMPYVFQAIKEYSQKHDGQLPPLSQWNDELISGGFSGEYFLCNQTDQSLKGTVSNYAFNSNLTNAKFHELPNDMVLVFECENGWNVIGQSDIAKGHLLRSADIEYVNVLFADGSIRHVGLESVSGLRWK